MAQLVERPDLPLEELLQRIACLLPPAWQYPEITVGRVLLDGRCHASAASWDGVARQAADIVVGDAPWFGQVTCASSQLDEDRSRKEPAAQRGGARSQRSSSGARRARKNSP
jgi:hypothetical protein